MVKFVKCQFHMQYLTYVTHNPLTKWKCLYNEILKDAPILYDNKLLLTAQSTTNLTSGILPYSHLFHGVKISCISWGFLIHENYILYIHQVYTTKILNPQICLSFHDTKNRSPLNNHPYIINQCWTKLLGSALDIHTGPD